MKTDGKGAETSASPGKPEANRNAVQPSGPRGDNPATAGPGETHVVSETPENRDGQINPSAPNDSTTSADTASGKNRQ